MQWRYRISFNGRVEMSPQVYFGLNKVSQGFFVVVCDALQLHCSFIECLFDQAPPPSRMQNWLLSILQVSYRECLFDHAPPRTEFYNVYFLHWQDVGWTNV